MAKSRPTRRWAPLAVCTAISVGAFGLVWGVRAAGRLQTLELKAYDLFVRGRRPAHSMADKVVVIGLTEDEISSKRVSYPISDKQLARLLEKVLACDPRAVGVDIIRDVEVITAAEAREEMVPAPQLAPATAPTTAPLMAATGAKSEGRRRLEAVWLNNDRSDRLAMVALLSGDGRLIGKADAFPDERVGLAEYPLDADQVVRRGLLVARSDRGPYPSMASLLAQIYLAQGDPPVGLEPVPPDDPNARDLKLGATTFRHLGPDDGAYVRADTGGIQYLLDYKDRPEDFAHYIVWDVLRDDSPVRPEDLRGKVVLIGVTAAPTLKDYLDTPLGPSANGLGTARYGVDVHAAAVAQLLRAALHGDRPVRFWPDRYEALWVLLFALTGGAVGYTVRAPWKIALTMAACVVTLSAVCWGAFAAGWWLPFVPSLGVWGLSLFGTVGLVSYLERSDRQIVQMMLAVNVSGDVARTLWDQRHQFLADGRIDPQTVTATVLFTDLKGFSSVSEKMPADRVMRWLNGLMEALAEDVYANGGMVNKYIGDAVMALFGVPVPGATDADRRRDACNAVRCAMAMRATLDRLNRQWKAEGYPEIGMRIGVYTGELVAGQLGSSKRRLEYTVIGDTVNTASRLESHDKDLADPDICGFPATPGLGCRILIGQPTHDLLDCGFRTRYINDIELKGKKVKIAVYGVIDRKSAGPDGPDGPDGPPAGGGRTVGRTDGPVQGTPAGDAVEV